MILTLTNSQETYHQNSNKSYTSNTTTPTCMSSIISTPTNSQETYHQNTNKSIHTSYTMISTSNFQELLSPEEVVAKYKRMMPLSKIGRLAVKLARESFFGEELMKSSTVFGCQDKPALPKEKLGELKLFLIEQNPQFRRAPEEFEPFWKTCVDSINHACANLHKKSY